MLVEFSVANFKSIKEKQTLSLIAAPIVAKEEKVDESNVIKSQSGVRLLKSLAIYGPNASGKSNLVKAMVRMMTFIEKSFQDEEFIKRMETFALDRKYRRIPMHFELVFLTKGNLYRYGFEITNHKVSAEWLLGPAQKNEVEYFTRQGDKITVNKTRFKEGVDLTAGKTRTTTLFLNVTNAFNGPIAGEIKDFFRQSMFITTGLADSKLRNITLNMLKRPEAKAKVLELMKAADFGIEEISPIKASELKFDGDVPSDLQEQMKAGKEPTILTSLRMIKNANQDDLPIAFVFDWFESEGTKKFLTYVGPIIQSLQFGATLVIDEFDARWHPALTRRIVELFNSKEHNKKNAQLIFVTHDINLLDSSLLRRDQIYFAEKNAAGETTLISLINIGGVRNDASYEKDYMKGKYGAMPFLTNIKI